MKKTLSILILASSVSLHAQDSAKVGVYRRFTHQIGFNGTLLAKQLLSDNPASQLTMLPYQVDYTLGFSEKWGARLGVGFDQSYTSTSIQGQNSPRTTNTLTTAYRLDLVRNLLSYKKFSSGVFLGPIMNQANLVTKTTNDQSASGGPITTDELTSKSSSYGAEIGIGLKYSFNQHIGIGTEMPIQVKQTVTNETDKQTSVSGSFSSFNQEITATHQLTTKIFLPTSVFLLITF
ncbi:MAG: outer membrane beta-barrel protein [Bacteroidia bacterium]